MKVNISFSSGFSVNAGINISVGTIIPASTQIGSIESQRLQNFYSDIYKQARIFTFKFTQNLLDSDFQLGQFLMHFDVGDGRQ